MKRNAILIVVGAAVLGAACFVLGMQSGKRSRQHLVSSLLADLGSARLAGSSGQNHAAATMYSALVQLQRDQDVASACRELNNGIDRLLILQTVEMRQGVQDPPATLTFEPYERFWFQTAYDVRRHREQYPVEYESAKWEAQIRSILETKGPVLVKDKDDRTTGSS